MLFNLSDNFNPFGEGLPYSKFNFPSGCEPHIKLIDGSNSKDALITTRIQSGNDLLTLFLATDALRRGGVENISVFIPFMPFARQDRVMVAGEPLSIKVIADLINAQNYQRVMMYDVHSDVTTALIYNAKAISNHTFVANVLRSRQDYLICSPDAGAYKKIFNLCQYIGYHDEIILANKVRDVSNGHIKHVSISNTDLKGKTIYIVDDICDGGGTFLLLADKLRQCNAGKVNLIVSHGIFSQGEAQLKSKLDKVYTTDSLKDIVSDFICQSKLNIDFPI